MLHGWSGLYHKYLTSSGDVPDMETSTHTTQEDQQHEDGTYTTRCYASME